jgi:hypothetical protein
LNDSLEDFFAGVRASCTEHAVRKGYTKSGPDEGDVLGGILNAMGVSTAHGVGEIITKLVEYRKSPRRVLMEKVGGWAWSVWKDTED